MSAQDTGDALQGCGQALSAIGCLMTLFITVPIILLMLFVLL